MHGNEMTDFYECDIYEDVNYSEEAVSLYEGIDENTVCESVSSAGKPAEVVSNSQMEWNLDILLSYEHKLESNACDDGGDLQLNLDQLFQLEAGYACSASKKSAVTSIDILEYDREVVDTNPDDMNLEPDCADSSNNVCYEKKLLFNTNNISPSASEGTETFDVDFKFVDSNYDESSVIYIQRFFKRRLIWIYFDRVVDFIISQVGNRMKNIKRVIVEVYESEKVYNDFICKASDAFGNLTSDNLILGGKPFHDALKRVCEFSNELLHEFDNCIKWWPQDRVQIAHVFFSCLSRINVFSEYTVVYRALHDLKKMYSWDEKIRSEERMYLQEKKINLDLFSVLIMPVQRLTRYALLLKEIMTKFNINSAEYKTFSKVYEALCVTCESVNVNNTGYDNIVNIGSVIAELNFSRSLSLFFDSQTYVEYLNNVSNIMVHCDKNNTKFLAKIYLFNCVLLIGQMKSKNSLPPYELFGIFKFGAANIVLTRPHKNCVSIVEHSKVSGFPVTENLLYFESKKLASQWYITMIRAFSNLQSHTV